VLIWYGWKKLKLLCLMDDNIKRDSLELNTPEASMLMLLAVLHEFSGY
jgi:hypothetical protein